MKNFTGEQKKCPVSVFDEGNFCENEITCFVLKSMNN